VDVRVAVLDVDDADEPPAAERGNGEEGFIAVFRELVEETEARIFERAFGNGDRLDVFGDPFRDSLADVDLEVVDGFRMRIHGCAKNEAVALEGINPAGIAANDKGNEGNDLVEDVVQGVGNGDAFGDLVDKVDIGSLKARNDELLGHTSKLGPPGGGCPIRIPDAAD
jgi:hypothetical protein